MCIFSMLNSSCKKDAVQVIQTNNPPVTESPMVKKMIAIKTENWKVYPYIGGPDEDSVYFSWSSDLGPYKVIDSVVIFSADYIRYYAPQVQMLPTPNIAYVHQPGGSLNAPNKILLWWTQKVPGTRPDADSAYFYLRF